MLGNCENMALISSTNNEWPQQQHQNHTLDEKSLMAASTGGTGGGGGGRVAEKQIIQDQSQIQLNQPALKCPRCDSSNTKFCYYNNYSLSQPRHFCKACKRYWTRGGTLRNVPVGGGCRKNKRVKRPSSSSSSAIDTPSSSSSAPSSNPNPNSIQSHLDLSSTSNHMSSMFYGLQTNPSDLSYSRFNPRVSNVDTVSGFDLQPQLSALGLGFSSEFNGFNTSNPLLSTYPMFGSSATSNSPTMASLLPNSSFHQQKYLSNGLKDLRGGNNSSFHGLAQYQDLQMQGNNSAGKEVKMEEAQGRINWDLHGQNQTHHDQINSSDPNLYWNGSGFGGAWLDPGNIGSSVPSLI